MSTNKYGEAAIQATKLYTSKLVNSPQDAWEQATKNIFGEGTSSQKKGCPKGAFLGLCEEGLVKGIPRGKFTNSTKNKDYAVLAVAILKNNTSLASDTSALWKSVLRGIEKQHNSQMDVVTALWNNGFIIR